MMPDFDELARGATELRVKLQRGDIVVRVAEDASWRLDWSGQGAADPDVERAGHAVEVRQRGGRLAGQRPGSGMGFKNAFGGGGGIVGEVMSEVGGIVDEVGGIVDDVMGEVFSAGGLRGPRLELRLTVPATVESVELATGWGTITVEGVRGHLRASTGLGALTLRSIRGEGEVSTGSGDVTIERYDGRLTASSGNGKIRLERLGGEAVLSSGNGRVEALEAEGTLRIHTGNGAITLTGASGEAELNSGRGDVEISAARGLAATAKTGAGAIRVEGGSVRSLRLNSMMGSLSLAADLAPGSYDLTSGMGGITVELPDDVRARIDAQTGFGQVQSDFPLVRVGRSGPLGFGAVRMVGSIGTGDPQVELSLRSGKGEITLRRATTPGRLPAPPRAPAAPRPPMPPAPPSTPAQPAAERDETLSILESLARGEITPAQAEDLLSGQKAEGSRK